MQILRVGEISVNYATEKKLKLRIYTEHASTNTSQCKQRNTWVWD